MTRKLTSISLLASLMSFSACTTVGSGPQPLIGGASLSADECASIYKTITATGQPSEQFCKSAQALVGQTSEAGIATDKPIEYSDTPAFSATLSRSIQTFAIKRITVKLTEVPLNITDYRDLKPPYTSTALNAWLAAVERGGGKVCEVENSNSVLIPLLIKFGLTLGSQLLNRVVTNARTASLYGPAKNVNALVRYNRIDANAPGSGRITTVEFRPKSEGLECKSAAAL